MFKTSLSDVVRADDGEVASLLLSYDWSGSPLGPPEQWPRSLHTIAGLLLNSKFPMFVAWGPELALIYNDAYVEMLVDKHPAAIGQPFETVWSDIWQDIEPIVERAMAGESSFYENLPLLMRRKGYDEQTWFTFSYSPVHDDDGRIAGLYCACTETTQQVLAARHRLDENERLRHLFQQAPGVMAVLCQPGHVFELANDSYYELVGRRELIGKSVREALPELDGQGLFELLDEVYRTGEPFVGRAVPVKLRRRESGELEERFVDFIYQPIRDHLGNVSGIFVEGSDVSDAVKATQALRESEQHLRQLANTIPHLAWIAGPDGNIEWYNDRWYEFTGTTFEEMAGWGWQSLHDPERLPNVIAHYQRCLQSGEPFELTFPLRSATGEYRTFFTRATPVRDEAGNIVQWFGTNTDIHEMEQAQEELKAANRRKDEFLAMLAHELRNPLAPISSAAELLKLSTLDEQRVRKTSEIISRQVAHMTELVDDLLDVSRVTRGLVTLHKEPQDLKAIVADAVEQASSLIEHKRQHLLVEVGNETPVVEGDRTRLTQIFSNILNNATKYTPEHGHITLSVVAHPDEVAVTVTDDGIGVDPQLLPHLFELFTQAERSPDRAQGGLGLGLALVKSLVGLHGGSVAGESAGRGKGSRFTVRLPRVIDLEPARANRPTPHATATSVLDILLVDDNADAAHTLAMLLEYQGHKVAVQYAGRTALAQIAQSVPQVMILDIGLPDMDGYELATHIRALPQAAGTILIALTGYGQADDRARSQQAGFDYHLVKPVAAQELLGVLTEIVQARQ